MQTKIVLIGALALGAAASCARQAEAKPPAPRKPLLFMDSHDLGPGKVTAQAVAEAHARDLATQAKYGVAFKAYWVDEKAGRIYCLAEAPSGAAINQVHKEAHGLVAAKVAEVTGDNLSWTRAPGMKLYMDVHHLGAGKVDARAVAAAHQKDLAVEAKHGVKYLNYWLDAASGTVMCLTEAPSPEAALAVHREAHGLMPESIEEVAEGR